MYKDKLDTLLIYQSQYWDSNNGSPVHFLSGMLNSELNKMMHNDSIEHVEYEN